MYSASGTQAYAKVSVESAVMSASSDQLITLLFDGALSALVRARLFLQEGNIVRKGESLSKAINIIDNGLKVGLDEASEDELTRNLLSLYRYMVHRLLRANLDNDVAGIEEVEALLRNIADAWKEVSGSPALVQDAL
uniref:flagellar export chaperone FliS n=1 Tax=Pantoea sp. IMH TaxID=1267600 RepID=UPI000467F990|nr:flagellar export chaperone FliS [Pantoea sp. IMH]